MTADTLLLNTDEPGCPGRIAAQRNLAQTEIQQTRGYRRDSSILACAGISAAAGVGLDLSAYSKEGLPSIAFAALGSVLGALIGRHAVIMKGKQIYVGVVSATAKSNSISPWLPWLPAGIVLCIGAPFASAPVLAWNAHDRSDGPVFDGPRQPLDGREQLDRASQQPADGAGRWIPSRFE